MRDFCGHPLIAYTIAAARQSGIFDCGIAVSSDDQHTLEYAIRMGLGAYERSSEASTDDAADILWMKEVFAGPMKDNPPQAFAILRPTSPFRTAETIRRAWAEFKAAEVHSLRAVEPVTEHPGKMWTWEGQGYPIKPLLDRKRTDGTPWHSSPTQSLPVIYRQNASLEMAWTYVVRDLGSISGTKVLPFFTKDYEGFDINTERDWNEAERLVRDGLAVLPMVPSSLSA